MPSSVWRSIRMSGQRSNRPTLETTGRFSGMETDRSSTARGASRGTVIARLSCDRRGHCPRPKLVISSREPLPQLDVVAVWVADLRPRVRVANSRAPYDLDTLGPQIVGRLRHVFDFERDHAVPEVLTPWSRLDSSALVRDQFDDRAAEVQVHEINRHT